MGPINYVYLHVDFFFLLGSNLFPFIHLISKSWDLLIFGSDLENVCLLDVSIKIVKFSFQ